MYPQEHTPSVSWQELQMASGKLKGGKFTLVGMGRNAVEISHYIIATSQ